MVFVHAVFRQELYLKKKKFDEKTPCSSTLTRLPTWTRFEVTLDEKMFVVPCMACTPPENDTSPPTAPEFGEKEQRKNM